MPTSRDRFSQLHLECFKLGLALGQIAKIHRLGLSDNNPGVVVPLQLLVARINAALQGIGRRTDLASTPLSRMVGRHSHRNLRPLLYSTPGSELALGIADEFRVASVQLAESATVVVEGLVDWLNLGLELGSLNDERDSGEIEWHDEKKLDRLLSYGSQKFPT